MLQKIICKKDFPLSIFMVGLGTLIQVSTRNLSTEARMLPVLVSYLMFVLGAWLFITCFKNNGETYSHTSDFLLAKHELVVLLVLAVTVQLSSVLGFYTSVFLGLIAITMMIFGVKNKKWIFSIAFALVITAVLFSFFDLALSMSMPKGLLF